ncbi:MAG: hypothetical protein H0X66_16790 [Verrucomicrobia bacterium]|nr:hypothetical protein [Verrucomicrobiota bacterium]
MLLGVLEVSADDINPPRSVMSTQVAQFLSNAINSGNIPNAATNTAAFDVLRQVEVPDVSRMKRVRYRDRTKRGDESHLFQGGWLFYAKEEQLILLDPGFGRESRLSSQTILEDADYRSELRELLGVLGGGTTGEMRVWDWKVVTQALPESRSTMPIFWHAVGAASLGFNDEAFALIQLSLNRKYASSELWNYVRLQARDSMSRGFNLTREGAPRSEVLAQWEATLQTYGSKLTSTDLNEYVALLKEQIADFPRIQQSTVEAPETLPAPTRATYYLDRFPDIKSGSLPENTLEDLVIALGRDAIPACIAHLNDRRLTRVVRYGISSNSGTKVLRVQDFALACIERITGVRFLNIDAVNGINTFSSYPAEGRKDLVRSVVNWWEANSAQSGVMWRLSQIESLSLEKRVAEIEQLEKLDPTATNYVSLLKRWAVNANQSAVRTLARPLAARGDLSLLPRLREELQTSGNTDVRTLLKYGLPEDYGLLRDAERKRRLKNPQANDSLYVFSLSFLLSSHLPEPPVPTNLFLVPLLVDGLAYREIHEMRKDTSVADDCVYALIQITGHKEGYERGDERDQRNAAIDRWADWWTRIGQKEWLATYPQTRPAFGNIDETPSKLDLASFPEVIPVLPAGATSIVRYSLPREQVGLLVQRGIIHFKEFAGVTQFRFTSETDEYKFFRSTKPAAFNKKTGDKRLVSTMPMLSSNSFLLPMMRFEGVALATPDTKGGTWVVQYGSPNIVAIYDGNRHTIRWSYTNEHRYTYPDPWRGALPLDDGAMLLFQERKQKRMVHLFAGKEHLQFPSIESLAQREASRMRRWLSSAPLWRDTGFNPIVTDKSGNIWWVEGNQFGLITGTNKILSRCDEFLLGTRTYASFGGLIRHDRTGVIVSVHDAASLLFFDGERICKGGNVTLPRKRLSGMGYQWPRFVGTRDELIWVGSSESEAFDFNMKPAAKFPGEVLLSDNRGGVWFSDYSPGNGLVVLIRVSKDGQESRLELPGLIAVPCLIDNSTAWVHTGRGLVKIRYSQNKLEVVSEASSAFPHEAKMWIDRAGCLWIASVGVADGRTIAVCYSTR